ncbi:hypothetical protein [Halocatena marina]|uniref:hypothetical protein n=1 Tax=Halocatena marina TaxID=2934937 RepID=UPI00200DEF7B|nr:hypothetical protein [Halocatena marina]
MGTPFNADGAEAVAIEPTLAGHGDRINALDILRRINGREYQRRTQLSVYQTVIPR